MDGKAYDEGIQWLMEFKQVSKVPFVVRPDTRPAPMVSSAVQRRAPHMTHSRAQSVPAAAFKPPMSPHRDGGESTTFTGLAPLRLVERFNVNPPPTAKGDEEALHNAKESPPPRKGGRHKLNISVTSFNIPQAPPPPPAPPKEKTLHTRSVSLGKKTEPQNEEEEEEDMRTLHMIETDASAAFLTLIAYQERRVVELRDELTRESRELALLKRQWVTQQRRREKRHANANRPTTEEGVSSLSPRQNVNSSPIIASGRKIAGEIKDGLNGIINILEEHGPVEDVQPTRRSHGEAIPMMNMSKRPDELRERPSHRRSSQSSVSSRLEAPLAHPSPLML